jgi:hypothetical protein
MIAELTKMYARKGKASTGPSTNDTLPMTAMIHHEPMKLCLEGELVKLKILVPLKDLICNLG